MEFCQIFCSESDNSQKQNRIRKNRDDGRDPQT